MWILTSKMMNSIATSTIHRPNPAEQRGAEQHAEQATVDRVARHRVRPVGAEPAIATDPGCHAPHRTEREPGPQREDGQGDEHREPEDPHPRDPDGQDIKAAAAGNRQAGAHHRQDDERRRAGLAAGPLTRSMRGPMRRTEGVVQQRPSPTRPRQRRRTRRCQPLRACGSPQGWPTPRSPSRRRHSNHHLSSASAGA